MAFRIGLERTPQLQTQFEDSSRLTFSYISSFTIPGASSRIYFLYLYFYLVVTAHHFKIDEDHQRTIIEELGKIIAGILTGKSF